MPLRATPEILGARFAPVNTGARKTAMQLAPRPDIDAAEIYRARLITDAESCASFAMAWTAIFILPEERSFVGIVDGASGLPSTLACSREIRQRE